MCPHYSGKLTLFQTSDLKKRIRPEGAKKGRRGCGGPRDQ
ncbi:hypothetical protein HMPREF0239_02195 [Clostridium sp. ATCC BAA-442]|uniref:Uncharacterized protein n=1 Tax=Flavonifractor plautii ATCC 29863 TaxID=411475 RepID=G9YL91_FLAPL|nr:hypothetical protein HMPREF0372_00254 [Flavonifractor plautii ATCC 29863]ERI76337.1 hypothetical protein HMPREF0239_02195 [Clostridium sp. ATCC BAA-442]